MLLRQMLHSTRCLWVRWQTAYIWPALYFKEISLLLILLLLMGYSSVSLSIVCLWRFKCAQACTHTHLCPSALLPWWGVAAHLISM